MRWTSKFLVLPKDVKQIRRNEGQNSINLRIQENVLLFSMGQKVRKDHIQSHSPWSHLPADINLNLFSIAGRAMLKSISFQSVTSSISLDLAFSSCNISHDTDTTYSITRLVYHYCYTYIRIGTKATKVIMKMSLQRSEHKTDSKYRMRSIHRICTPYIYTQIPFSNPIS